MDVGVANHHLHISDAVNVEDELVELLKLAGLDPVQGEPAELCSILKKDRNDGRENCFIYLFF